MPLIVWVTNYHMNTDCCTPGSNKNQKEKSKKDKNTKRLKSKKSKGLKVKKTKIMAVN